MEQYLKCYYEKENVYSVIRQGQKIQGIILKIIKNNGDQKKKKKRITVTEYKTT